MAPQPPLEVAALPIVDRMALAMRLAHTLGSDALAELVTFIEDRRDGTLVMLKEDGGVVDVRSHRRLQADEPRQAAR
jgi:hypothetical protein